MIDIFIDCEPPTVTAQQKGEQVVRRKDHAARTAMRKSTHKTIHFKKPEIVALEQQFIRWFLPKRPAARMEGPVRLEVAFIYPWRQADLPKRLAGNLPAYVIKVTKPDTDNSLKLLKDTLTACKFWHDDAQVGEEVTRKGWGDRIGIHVRVMPCLNDYLPPGEEPL